MAVKTQPTGYHTVIPYIVVPDLKGLIAYNVKTFEGEVIEQMDGPNDRVMHAEVKIGDSVVMMGEPRNEQDEHSTAMLYVYVPDVDATYKKALDAGGTSLTEPTDQFYGDRSAGVADSWGNKWWIATHVEDVSPEEMQKRMAAMGG